MERSDKNKPLWRKITTGKIYPFSKQRGRRVKPQEQIRAAFEEIARVIDHFELIEDGKGEFKVGDRIDKAEKEAKPEAPAKDKYSIESAGGGWYNVLNPEGEVMNEKKLRQEDADALKGSLEEETDQ